MFESDACIEAKCREFRSNRNKGIFLVLGLYGFKRGLARFTEDWATDAY